MPLKFQVRKLIIEVKWWRPYTRGPINPFLSFVTIFYTLLCTQGLYSSFGITLKCFLFSLFFVVSLKSLSQIFLYLCEMFFSEDSLTFQPLTIFAKSLNLPSRHLPSQS